MAFAGFEAVGVEALAETSGCLEGLALGRDLRFQHVERPPDDEEHGVGHGYRVL